MTHDSTTGFLFRMVQGANHSAWGQAGGLSGDSPRVALTRLQKAFANLKVKKPRHHQVAILRVFGRLDARDVAESLGLDERSVREHWRFARAYLLSQFHDRETHEEGGSDNDRTD